jgi:hypothetical protein
MSTTTPLPLAGVSAFRSGSHRHQLRGRHLEIRGGLLDRSGFLRRLYLAAILQIVQLVAADTDQLI